MGLALTGCAGDGNSVAIPIIGLPGPTQSPTPSSTAAPTAAPTAADTGGSWELVWADEFDAPSIDPTRWNLVADCWGGGNREQQCYTVRAENVSVANGVLMLTAREESFTGDAWTAHMKPSQANPDEQRTQPFTSGKITTKRLASWQYGRSEMRARLPHGQGTWPAFWMLPENDDFGGWPLSGEIDIFEAVNHGVECANCEPGGEQSVLGTLHYGNRFPGNVHRSREIAYPGVLDGEFHTYGVIWEEGRFTWLVDHEPFGTIAAPEWFTAASNETNAPFNRPFHLILNFAVGGNWPESAGLGGISTNGFPKIMEVDWVRVWQCDADAASGLGCTGGT
nr:glycoside hydrolase family 16 protein [Aurantiacibacter marinus]